MVNFLQKLTLVALCLSASFASGEVFEGQIQKAQEKIHFIRTSDHRSFEIVPNTVQIQETLRRLDKGDYVYGEGIYDSSNNKAYLKVIHFVGLSKILGRWKTRFGEVFDFENFRDLRLYFLGPVSKDRSNSALLNYSLSPTDNDSWSVLFVDNSAVDIGQLQCTEKSMLIQLIDGKTGKVTQEIPLTRVK